MLYLIYGSDSLKIHEKSSKLIKTMLSKKPDAAIFKLTSDNWNVAELQELIGGQGLFSSKYIVHISHVLDDSLASEDTLSFLSEIQSSENIFVWTESEIDLKKLKQIEKYAEKVEEHVLKENIKLPPFNIFSLADAVGNRDKKRAWMLYVEAINYFLPEEIHGTLFWQVKSMILASKTKSAEESGMKPFVYSKSKRCALNYSLEELEKLSSKLISVVHDSRRGKIDFSIALEKMMLELK